MFQFSAVDDLGGGDIQKMDGLRDGAEVLVRHDAETQEKIPDKFRAIVTVMLGVADMESGQHQAQVVVVVEVFIAVHGAQEGFHVFVGVGIH